MAVSLAELIILSLLVDYVLRKARIPGLVGMLLVGILLGPYVLAYLDPSLLKVSSDLRMIALIVILLRAGFELSKETLKKVGFRAALLSFVPAVFEAAAVTALGPRFLPLTYLESAILGTVLAAVSPAVVVPLMLDFMDRKKGTDQGIPTLMLAGSSIDDVFVIVAYSALIGFYTGRRDGGLLWKAAEVPVSILVGVGVGLVCGYALYRMFERFNPRATKRLLVILGVSVVLVSVEPRLERFVPFAALLAVMGMGVIILEKNEYMAHEISSKLAKLWVFAEILLFTLVGAQVNVQVAWKAGLAGSALIGLGLAARSVGTYLCFIGSSFTQAERLFMVVAYVPKATVQAAIGGAPLAAMAAAGMDTAPGEIILAVAVLSILLTAPAGAWAISLLGERILKPAKSSLASSGGEPPSEEALAASAAVEEVMRRDVIKVRSTDDLERVLEAFARSEFSVCPVTDAATGALCGVIALDDLRPVLASRHSWRLILAGDACRHLEDGPLHPDDSLLEAREALSKQSPPEAPVVDETGAVVGILRGGDVERFLKERWLEAAGRAAPTPA